MGALEIHAWGCRSDRLDAPDQLVFDIDPDEGLAWERVLEAAHTLRAHLEQLGLGCFVRVTGGKGLHIVTPVVPETAWDQAKQFCKGVAAALAEREPGKYLATMSKRARKGKIFIDYLRNGAGATAICSYSTRTRAGATVAVPISWAELDAGVRSDAFDVENIVQRLATLKRDPWEDFDDLRAPIPSG
jgi:bifunctional non-homologous end joining protein LigD